MPAVVQPLMKQLVDVFVGQRIEDMFAFLARVDDTHRTQNAQLIRNGRLAHAEHGAEIADAQLGVGEQAHDAHTGRIGQRLEEFGEQSGGVAVQQVRLRRARQHFVIVTICANRVSFRQATPSHLSIHKQLFICYRKMGGSASMAAAVAKPHGRDAHWIRVRNGSRITTTRPRENSRVAPVGYIIKGVAVEPQPRLRRRFAGSVQPTSSVRSLARRLRRAHASHQTDLMTDIDPPRTPNIPPEVLPLRARQIRVPKTFAALRHRNFRLFLGGQLVSLAGTWMQIIAQGWLVYQLSGSELALGVVGSPRPSPCCLLLRGAAW